MAAEETSDPSKISGERQSYEGILSPGFRSAAAMAGWDEEALLASLVVEDTPVREPKHKKRSIFPLKTPPTDSRRKRRSQRRSSNAIPVVVLCLDDDENVKQECGGAEEKKSEEMETVVVVDEQKASVRKSESAENDSCKPLPCMEQLREELSCAICLDICFEPSTTPCGHSFCMKCLKCAAAKCGKRCPKCRQLISNGRACTVNTVLWNTIQLLFPEEVEAKKKVAPPSQTEEINQQQSPERSLRSSRRNGSFILSSELVSTAELYRSMRRNATQTSSTTGVVESRRSMRRRAPTPSQSEDAALALRLQREEFMGSVVETRGLANRGSSVHSARANLRAMASRAIQIRARNRFS